MYQASLIGESKNALDTPVLLVDLGVLNRNIERMAGTIIRDAGVNWRPHTKSMKTPALAHMLLDSGASGITCAKLSEAEVMATAGIRDILVANQVVGPRKITRLVNLRKQADVIVTVDDKENVNALNCAALEAGVQLRLLIEVNTGMNRAGVEPGKETLALAQSISHGQGLKFSGLMTWEAHALNIADPDEKRRVVASAIKHLTDTAELCREHGLPIDIVSCGGTGTYWISASQLGITEVEAGGGIFCDVKYRRQFGVEHDFAMTVLSMVTSRPTSTRIICDAGFKTMSSHHAEPEPLGISHVESVKLSAEHGIVSLTEPSDTPRVGDQIEFIVGYTDSTVVLHDVVYGIRDGVIEVVWPLLGRGKLQ